MAASVAALTINSVCTYPYAFSPFLQSFGGDIVDRSTYKTAEGALNGEDAVAFGNWWQSLFKDGYAQAAELSSFRDRLVRDLKRHGALVLDVGPGQLTPALINRYLEIKARHLL